MRILLGTNRLFNFPRFENFNKRYLVSVEKISRVYLFRAKTHPFDLLCLDCELISFSAMQQFVLSLRKCAPQTPVVLFRARYPSHQRATLLQVGADLCLQPECDTNEITAHFELLFRRPLLLHNSIIKWRNLEFDTQSKIAFWKKKELSLSFREQLILEKLLRHPGKIFSKQKILDLLWQEPHHVSLNLVEVHISSLRKKLKQVGAPNIIKTKRQVGYLIPK